MYGVLVCIIVSTIIVDDLLRFVDESDLAAGYLEHSATDLSFYR